MRLAGSFYFAVLYLVYEFCTKPVWLDAVNICLSGFPSDYLVCGAMGVTYLTFPPSLAELNEFRTEILDPPIFTWVKLGTEDWYRLTEIGTVYRNFLKGPLLKINVNQVGPMGLAWNTSICVVCRRAIFREVVRVKIPLRVGLSCALLVWLTLIVLNLSPRCLP